MNRRNLLFTKLRTPAGASPVCHWPRPCSSPQPPDHGPRRAFSLLEVILSLAILAGAVAALGEVMRQADRNASLSNDETQAQIIASSVMDEITSGFRALASGTQSVYDGAGEFEWACTIEVTPTNRVELLAVRVLVEQQIDARLQPARFELVRWIANPDYMQPDPATEEEEESSSSSGSGSSSGGSSSGGGTGGGP